MRLFNLQPPRNCIYVHQVIDAILKKKMPIDCYTDSRGITLLIAAILTGSMSTVSLAISYGANTRLPDRAGTPPLHYAASNKKIYNILIKAGANPHQVDKKGVSSRELFNKYYPKNAS
jgi:ankyrin repeat protein